MDSLHAHAIFSHTPGPLHSPVLKPRQVDAAPAPAPPSRSIVHSSLEGDATLPYEPPEPFRLQSPCRQHGFQSLLQRIHQPVPQQLFSHASFAGQHNSDHHLQEHLGDHLEMKPSGDQGHCSPPPSHPLLTPLSPSDSTQHFSPAKGTSPQSGNTLLSCLRPAHTASPAAHHTARSPPMPAPMNTLHTSPTRDNTPTSPTASIRPAAQRAPPPVRKRTVACRASSPATPTRSMPSTPGPPPWCEDNISMETMPMSGGTLLYVDDETSRACAPTATAVAATAGPPQTPPPRHATHTHAYTHSHLCASTNTNTLTPTIDNNVSIEYHNISSSPPKQSTLRPSFCGVLPSVHGCAEKAAAGDIYASGTAPSPSAVPHGPAADGAVAVPDTAAAAPPAAVGHTHHAMPSPHQWSSWGRHAAATTNTQTPSTSKGMDCTSFRVPVPHNHLSTPPTVDQKHRQGQHEHHDHHHQLLLLQQQQQQQPGGSSTMHPGRPTASSPPPPSLLRRRPNPFSPPSQHISARKKLRFDDSGISSSWDEAPSDGKHGAGVASGAQGDGLGAGSGISNSSSKSGGGSRSGGLHHPHAPLGGTPPAAAVGWGSRGVYSRQGVRRTRLLSRLEDAASEGGTPSKGLAMGGGENMRQGAGPHPGCSLEGAGKKASVGRSLLSRLEEAVEGGEKTEAGSMLRAAKAGSGQGLHGVDERSSRGFCGREGRAVAPRAMECEGECSRADAVDVRRSETGGDFGGDEATAAGAEGDGDDGVEVPPTLPFALLRTRPFFSSSSSSLAYGSPSQSPAGPGRAPTVAAAAPSPSVAARQQQQQQQQQQQHGRSVCWFAGLGCSKPDRSDRGDDVEEEVEEVDGMSVLAARGAGRPEARLSSPSQASLLGSFYGSTGKAL